MKLKMLFVSLLLSGCSIIGQTPPPKGWPQLEISVYRLPMMEVNKFCGGVPLLFHVLGCAIVNIPKKVCVIVHHLDDGESLDLLIEHELEHCKGKDHAGSTALRDYFLTNQPK